ncbi:thioredoxin family protein [Candidatus Roizmanbacteria bacterium]|nr:thioredoxin family protein [Candidatus Roizmanbacteria bacterium]
MKIQVLGSGCATCKKLHEITQKAVSEMGIKEKVEYVTGPDGTQAIIEMGVMQSPVLVINGQPVMTGFTPDIEKIKKAISSGIQTDDEPSNGYF